MMPTALKIATSNGSEIIPASRRGTITRLIGSTAIISMPANCSVAFIRPISAVNAEPARPENNSADNTGPSSRTSDRSAPTAGPQGIVPDPAERLRRNGFSLGDWQVEPRRQRIVSERAVRRLDPKLIDVLIALATAPGEVLTRNELLESVWGETFVHGNSLSQAISRLRRALGDDASEPRYIETIS